MKNMFFKALAAALLLGFVITGIVSAQNFTKMRLIMMADMDNEPDEMQQNVHMLMYSNTFDVEGLIACTGLYLKTRVAPQLYTQLVGAYAKVYGNLKKHASGWPDTNYLYSIVMGSYPGYGKAAVTSAHSSGGSRLIDSALLKNDPRKIYFVGNAGTNVLLQALWDLDSAHFGSKGKAQMAAITSKIIVYENGSQDDCGAWIAYEYPDISWFRSNGQTYSWGGDGGISAAVGPYTWENYPFTTNGQDSWAAEHIRNNHGALGALYPQRHCSGTCWFLEGGGTTPWMGLANHGLADPEHLWWGGWSGRFSKIRQQNIWSTHSEIKPTEQGYGVTFWMYNSDSEVENWTDPVHNQAFSGFRVPVWRFRRAMWNDERARMDWCVKEYNQANHNPVAAVNGDTSDNIITMSLKPGAVLNLDASATKDPDNDTMRFNWWIYKEAGTYTGTASILNSANKVTSFTVPADANGKEIHVILEVVDTGNANSVVGMYDYRRIVINVGTTGVMNSNANNRMPNRSATVLTAGDQLVLPADFRNRECHLAVFDVAGKCVKQAVVKNRSISLSKQLSLTPGAYLVKIENVK